MANIKAITETLVNLTVKGVSELKELLKEEYGIRPTAATVAVAGPAADTAAETGEKNSFNVVLKSFGSTKLTVVRAVKEYAGLGLKEARELVDAAPASIKEGVDRATAETLKVALREAGAEAELK